MKLKVFISFVFFLLSGCSSHIQTHVSHNIVLHDDITNIEVNDIRGTQGVKEEGGSFYHTQEIISDPPLKDVLKATFSNKLAPHLKDGMKVEVDIIDAEFNYKHGTFKGSAEFKLIVESRVISKSGSVSKMMRSDIQDHNAPVGFNGIDVKGTYISFVDMAGNDISEKIISIIRQ